VIVGDFITPLSPINKSLYKKSKNQQRNNYDTIIQMYLINIYKVFHPTAVQYTFSLAHGTFSKINHIVGHKASLSRYKKI
jgi:hypothetical protein